MSAPQTTDSQTWTWTGPSFIEALSRYRVAVVVTVVLALAVGLLISTLRPETYTATASVILAEGDLYGEGAVDPTRAVERSAARLQSRAVLDGAAQRLNGLDREDLEDLVVIEPDVEAGIVDVVASGPTPERAAGIANVVVESYDEVSRAYVADQINEADEILLQQSDDLAGQIGTLEQEVASDPTDSAAQRRLELLQAQQQELQARLGELTADAALYGSGIQTIEEAVPPLEPSSPVPLRDAAIAGVLGLVLAVGGAYWRAQYAAARNTDPSAILGAPVLASIPDFGHLPETAGDRRFDREAAEAYQFLLSSFEYAVAQTGARSLVVTSIGPGDGKSLTALHLARALAVQGRDVVLLDSDIRVRGVTTMLGAQDDDGLVGLVGDAEVEDVTRRYRITESTQLAVIPAGRPPSQPTGLLATAPYREAIASVIRRHDLTIIDGAPLLTVADASAVAAQVDGVLLVVDRHATTEELNATRDRLRLVPTPLLGYVVNRVADTQRRANPAYGADAYVEGLSRGTHAATTSAAGVRRRRRVDAPESTDAVHGSDDDSSDVARASAGSDLPQ